MNKKELDLILKNHLKWLNKEPNGERADLRGAVLRGAVLRGADLTDADLTDAVLRGAVLRGAVLRGADLTNSKGLSTAKDYLSQFKQDKSGIYVYKTFGEFHASPDYWIIKQKSFIEEVVNPDRGTECGCGINFATLDWIKKHNDRKEIWLCRILWEDLADVVVPFNTDGKARCARLQLVKVIDPDKEK